MPQIPGYNGSTRGDVLGTLWTRPDGSYPSALWPEARLNDMDPRPGGWLVVEEHFFGEEAHGGVGCVLVPGDATAEALKETGWTGRDLGNVGIWDSGEFDNGLLQHDPPHAEFFVQARRPSGSKRPHVEIAYPFLWFWDAFTVPGGWKYLNRAGREQDLVRFELENDAWRVEVCALELRTFLAAYGKTAIIQVDLVLKEEEPEFDRVDAEYRNEWAHFDFHALHDGLMGERPAFSRLLGQYAVAGQRTSRVPRWQERREDRDYPEFVYGVDADTGQPLLHTCDPDKLGSYFDKDGTRLHYLTPIYFKREVLQPYTAEPGRYSVSASRLSCLDLWGVDISFNSAGLVEVYLGDLGRDLPSDEWGHWRTYNVPPEGRMDEGRFRRDFLNQFASSVDPVGDLRRAREQANQAAIRRLGAPLWRALPSELDQEFRSLIGPLTDDPAALNGPLLVLSKVFVDALDSKSLRRAVNGAEKGDQSLRLLQRLLLDLGDEEDSSKALRDLQALRSRGGIAHLANSESRAAASAMGVADLGARSAFDAIVQQLIPCLSRVTELLE